MGALIGNFDGPIEPQAPVNQRHCVAVWGSRRASCRLNMGLLCFRLRFSFLMGQSCSFVGVLVKGANKGGCLFPLQKPNIRAFAAK